MTDTSADQSVRPNFFIVGAPKSGTTSMHAYLSQHPQVFMSKVKAPSYFATDLGLRTAWSANEERYLSLFAGGRGMPVRGESSQSYLFNPVAAQRIHDFDPAARILIVLRNPLEAIQGLHGEARKYGIEPIRDLGRALAASDRGRPKVEGAYAGFWTRYREFVHYAPQVQRYLDVFSREQVLVRPYDDLVADPAALYREILEFLSVDPTFEPTFKRLNRHVGDVRSYHVQRAMMMFLSGQATTGTGQVPFARIYRAVLRRNSVARPRPPLDPAVRADLVSDLQDDIEALKPIVGRDLSHWFAPAAVRAA